MFALAFPVTTPPAENRQEDLQAQIHPACARTHLSYEPPSSETPTPSSREVLNLITPNSNNRCRGWRIFHHPLAGADVLPLLPTGGEGWGEEATFVECPSPHPSPRSCLAGRGRKFLVVVSRRA